MQVLTTGEFWSIVSSVVSLILGFFAIGLSVHFYTAGRNTEKQVSSSLAKIETQADMLQKLSGKQLDRLTRYVTAERADPTQEMTRLFLSITEMTRPLSNSLPQAAPGSDPESLKNELVTCYIAIYYYAAITNFWSQFDLPNPADFDSNNSYHQITRRVVESSCTDFNSMARILEKCEQSRLEGSPLFHLLEEARDQWRSLVRGPTDVYISRENQKSGPGSA